MKSKFCRSIWAYISIYNLKLMDNIFQLFFSEIRKLVSSGSTCAVRGEVTKAEGRHGGQWCVRIQWQFVNLCLYIQSRNTLIYALVWDTADSCKHQSNTHMLNSTKYKCTSLAPTHTYTHTPLTSNTIKPFSDFAWNGLNMEHSLNINSGYIKATVCSALLCDGCPVVVLGLSGCSRTRCDRGGRGTRGVPRSHGT